MSATEEYDIPTGVELNVTLQGEGEVTLQQVVLGLSTPAIIIKTDATDEGVLVFNLTSDLDSVEQLQGVLQLLAESLGNSNISDAIERGITIQAEEQ